MENIMESLTPSWIVTTTVTTIEKKNGEVMSYFNEKTCQTFHTRKDLDCYVKYEKKEMPEVYGDWTTDNKEKGVKKQKSKTKKRAKVEPDTAPNAPAKERLLGNGRKAVIVYSRKRKKVVAEVIEISPSSPPMAEPEDHLFYENMDLDGPDMGGM